MIKRLKEAGRVGVALAMLVVPLILPPQDAFMFLLGLTCVVMYALLSAE